MKLNFLHSTKVLLCLIALSLFVPRANAQYCSPLFFQGCALGGAINDFSLYGASSTFINDPATGCPGTPFGGYEDRTSETVTLNGATTYTITASTTPCLVGPSNFQVWIDFNNNFSFADPGEDVGGGVLGAAGSTNILITIPSGAATGSHRMRAEVSVGEVYPGINPCPNGTPPGSSNGEVHDYTVIIGSSAPACGTPTVTLGAVTCSTKVISWTAVTGASGGYEWIVNTTPASPTGSGTATSLLTVTATGPSAGTAYYAHVRTNCGTGFSSWVNLPFTTSGPAPIMGSTSVCTGSTTNLSDATPSGVWSSSNTTVATISATGVVYGTTSGTTVISYAAGGCTATVTVTVGSLPSITGATTVCPGSTTQLSDATPGGFWGSSNTSVATVGAGTGLVSGVTPGTSIIVYGTSATCTATVVVTVAALPAITGGSTVCVGQSITLSNSVGGGVWTSSNTTKATVAGGVVTGVATGSATITYTLGSCFVTKTLTIGAAIAPITGTTTFCVTGTTTLSDATPGGTWSSGDVTIATVSGTVTVYGVSGGAVTISYTVGGCSATAVVNVDPNNGGTITGKDSVCIGAGHEVTLSNAVTGGVWSSSNTTKATVDPSTGVVTGVSAGGTATIKYVVTNTCGTFTVTYVMHIRTAAQCASGVNVVAETELTNLNVFPNPNGGVFTMNLSSDIDEEVHVLVTNLLGQKVKEFTTTTNKMVDMKLEPVAGIYLLSASTAHGRYNAKVVIQK